MAENAFTFADLGLGAVDSGEILLEVQKASAFQSFGVEVDLPLQGAVVSTFSGTTAVAVGEGGTKKASGGNASVFMAANKAAVINILTDEFIAAKSGVPGVIWDQQPPAVAKLFDSVVLGLEDLPDEWHDFGTFKTGVDEVEISTGADASVDMDTALAAVKENTANGMVITTAMLAYLKAQRNSYNNARVFDITETTIDGLPYKTVQSNVKVGVVGNFNAYYWGNTPFVNPQNGTAYRISSDGTVETISGDSINLTGTNKNALFYEAHEASAAPEKDYFVKIVPATPAS